MSSGEFNVLLAGDVMTGRGVDQVLEHPSKPVLYESWAKSALNYVDLAERRNGPIPRFVHGDYLWGDALEVLDRPELSARIVNLETAVTVSEQAETGKGINYRMHPANTRGVLAGNVDCCVLANNHVLDWGQDGLIETLDSLEAAGVADVGAGTESEASRPRRVAPGAVVIALGVGSSGIPRSWGAKPERPGVALVNSLDGGVVETLTSSIADLASPTDLVVASLHWGPNWGYVIPATHRRFARALIAEAGVDIVHGHSSHHPLAIEVFRNRLILYGCGDLINDYEGIAGHEHFRPDLGIVYVATTGPTGELARLELIPFCRRRFRLEAASNEDRSWMRDRLDTVSGPGTTLESVPGGSLLLRW